MVSEKYPPQKPMPQRTVQPQPTQTTPQPPPSLELLSTLRLTPEMTVLTAPSALEIHEAMHKDTSSGRAYPWTETDIFNIVSTSLLIATAAHSIISLPGRITMAKYEARYEFIRRELFKANLEEERFAEYIYKDKPGPIYEQPSKVMWQNIQEPLRTREALQSFVIEEAREARLYQPISMMKHPSLSGLQSENILSGVYSTPTSWIASPALQGVKMQPKIFPQPGLKPTLAILPMQRQRLRQSALTFTEQIQNQRQIQQQIQAQRTQQIIGQQSITTPRSIPKTRFAPQLRLPSVSIPRSNLGPKGKWFLRTHPLLTPSQVMTNIIGYPKRRKGKKRYA